jgi:hypothetical protein
MRSGNKEDSVMMDQAIILQHHSLVIERLGSGLLQGTCATIPGLLVFEITRESLIDQAELVGRELLQARIC